MHQWHSRHHKLVLYVEWRLRQAGFDADGRDPGAAEVLDGILDELDARRATSLRRLCEELNRELPTEERRASRGKGKGKGREQRN